MVSAEAMHTLLCGLAELRDAIVRLRQNALDGVCRDLQRVLERVAVLGRALRGVITVRVV